MKNVLFLFSICFISIVTGCGGETTQGGSIYGGSIPSSYNSTATIKLNYTGSSTVSATSPIIMELYTTAAAVKAGLGTGTGFYGFLSYSASGTTQTKTIDNGTYYFLVYLDKNNDQYITAGEPYVIYSAKTKTDTPSSITLLYSALTMTVTLSDTNTW